MSVSYATHVNLFSDFITIPFLNHVITLPIFVKYVALWNKLKVYSTKERSINKNGITNLLRRVIN